MPPTSAEQAGVRPYRRCLIWLDLVSFDLKAHVHIVHLSRLCLTFHYFLLLCPELPERLRQCRQPVAHTDLAVASDLLPYLYFG